MTAAAPSLVTLVARRILLFSAVAMLAQLGGVYAEYWRDTAQLGRLAIERETGALAGGLIRADGRTAFELPASLRERYAHRRSGYFARLRTAGGTILFSNCDRECVEHFLPVDLDPPSFWMRELRPGRPLHVAGGRVVGEGEDRVLVEVAVIGDRGSVETSVLLHEVADHMALPMSLMLVVVLGATTLSIHRALRPVRRAARMVTKIDPQQPSTRLPTTGMPGEIAGFTQAVNAALDRLGELMRAQKIFASAISHEVRTPLAVARLELEKIADPRARKVEDDLEALNRLVEQLTTLARLDAGRGAPAPIDPLALAETVVEALAPLAFEAGRSIELSDADGVPFPGHADLVENALRNLVENAIRHSAPGSAIRVAAGPGARLTVADQPPAGAARPAREARTPADTGLGLRIVERIAAMHGGAFAFRSEPGAGSTAELDFRPAR